MMNRGRKCRKRQILRRHAKKRSEVPVGIPFFSGHYQPEKRLKAKARLAISEDFVADVSREIYRCRRAPRAYMVLLCVVMTVPRPDEAELMWRQCPDENIRGSGVLFIYRPEKVLPGCRVGSPVPVGQWLMPII